MITPKYLQIFLTYLLININSGQIEEYCKTTFLSVQAYNIGQTVFVSVGSVKTIWSFDSKTLIMQKSTLDSIFPTDTFEWVYAAFLFNFPRCDKSKPKDYCEITRKARSLAIVIGHRTKSSGAMDSGYITFNYNGELNVFPNNTELIWQLKTSSTVSGDFWIQTGSAKWYYSSVVFIPERAELLASVYDTEDKNKTHYLYSKTLNPNGNWSAWTRVGHIEFNGMFHIDNRTFGMTSKNMIHEIIISDKKYETIKIQTVKDFFNCNNNSTLVIKDRINPPEFPDHTKTVSSKLSTTHSNESSTDIPILDDTEQPSNQKSFPVLIIVIVIIIVIIVISLCICFCLYVFVFRNKQKEHTVEYQRHDKSKRDRSKSGSKTSKSEPKWSEPKPKTSSTNTAMIAVSSKPSVTSGKSGKHRNVVTHSPSNKSLQKSETSKRSSDRRVPLKPSTHSLTANKNRPKSSVAGNYNTVRSGIYGP